MCVELLDSLGGLDRAALLLADGLDDDGQAGDGGQHGAQNLSLQNLLGGQLGHGVDLIQGKDLAVHEAGLDGELGAVELLGKLVDDAHGSDGIFMADGQGRGAVEGAVHLLHTDTVDGEADQGVLHNGIVHLILAALGAQGGVFSHGDTLVVHQNAAVSSATTACFSLRIFALGMWNSPPEKIYSR